MQNSNRSELIDELLASYLKIPVAMFWERASGLPFPDRFENARLEFQGVATAWLNLEQIVWQAELVQFRHGLPASVALTTPTIELVVGQAELDRWLARFDLPYRLELAEDGLIVHTEIAGFPIAEFETSLEVVGGWFVLKPKRATFFGLPAYVSSMFRSYLPIPPLSPEARLAGIDHGPGTLRLRLRLDDFEEEVTPGMLGRLRTRFFPIIEQISGYMQPPSPPT